MAKQEINVTEVKTYQCSDGKVYDNKEMAEAHERELQDPTYSIMERVRVLENKVKELEEEIKTLRYGRQYFGPAAVLNGKQAEDFIDKLFGGTK